MNVTILTHEADATGQQCRKCGAVLASKDRPRWPEAARVGLVVTTYTNPVAYPIGEHDSNLNCK